MGLPFKIILYARDVEQATAASDAAFRRVQELNNIMSDYEPDSELNQLSRTSGQGKELSVSDDLWIVLKRSQDLAERSDGAFDISVGPFVSLWRKARRERKMPDEERLVLARGSVGFRRVRLNPVKKSVEFLAPGMRLDLGGIAKGYAIDEALKVLRDKGIDRALVAGGGDMAVGAPPPNKKGWRIELAPLDVENSPPVRFVLLSHAALAASGDLSQRVELDGTRYSHIVDPHTGVGLTDHSLVNIIARDCMTADSLATAVSVLGPKEGLKFLKNAREVAARIVRQPSFQIEFFETRSFSRFYIKEKAGER